MQINGREINITDEQVKGLTTREIQALYEQHMDIAQLLEGQVKAVLTPKDAFRLIAGNN